MIEKGGYVYIVTNKRNGTLYVGVTNDLMKRAAEHKNKRYGGFTAKYDANKLVYYETFPDIESAIRREKQLKDWNRNWKKDLIEKMNPEWEDLWWKFIKESANVIPSPEYDSEKINIKMTDDSIIYNVKSPLFKKINKSNEAIKEKKQ